MYADKEIGFYTVDCKAIEFCAKKKAQGYPTLLIYFDGKFVEEYAGNESIKDLVKFTNKHLTGYRGKRLNSF